ncbi:protein dopey-2 isoform X2 [Scleropages formosus]|uniref:protein dopey-2 isoform X2 n=1 Tax=Scleropages formosus TaxID=113540 RepID=UPI0010FA8AD7|nr:protein dopey-2 isoform X2 [Scleropages formosus]
MDPEEQELQNDYRYRSYSAVIEKALRNFESSSEWADLISSLGKLNKALQSNLKYSLLPRRLIIGKRLAQCLHPALPSGVHLKALETYEVIFKIIGTKWLAKDLFIYSSGLFPLLGHAAMSVKPVLLMLYERYYLPLQRALLPSLQAFVMGLLPGLEEGLEVYDRTDALLLKLSQQVGQCVFYGALWGSVLVSPLVRLPASHFIVTHFDRMATGREQRHMLGSDHKLVLKSICLSLQDSNVLVQRNMLEILLFFFPFCTCLDPTEASIPLSRDDVISLVCAASLTLLRRDMSLNRRLYAWLQGTDSKGSMLAPDPNMSSTLEEHMAFYFDHYSRELLLQAVVDILRLKTMQSEPETLTAYLRPFRIILSLLDKPEIGPKLTGDLMLEVIRALYSYVSEMLGEETTLGSSLITNQLASKVKESKNASEIIKTANMLISSLNSDYVWNYMTRCFWACLSKGSSGHPTSTVLEDRCAPPSVSEISTLIMFLLDVIPLELYTEIQTEYLPQMLGSMLQALRGQLGEISLSELTQALRACFRVLSKIQMPVAYMDMEAESQTHKDEAKENQGAIQGDGAHGEDDRGDKDSREEDVESEIGELDGEAELDTGLADAAIPTVRSEDSGLGLSTSTSEQHLSRERMGLETGVCPGRGDVWRKGGIVEDMTHSMLDILDSFISRFLLCPVCEEKKQQEAIDTSTYATGLGTRALARQRGSRELGQFREKLTEFFTPNKQKLQQLADFSFPSHRKGGKGTGEGQLHWGAGYKSRDRSDISEACRQAFTAICHLLLECSTFPVYLLEDERETLNTALFHNAGNDKHSLPVWLRSLMTLCCLSKDNHIQHVAISSVLELLNHSHSLALVIEDKNRRYKSSDSNPFSGQLQMLTIPPIYPRVFKAIEEYTDFYQRLAQVLWGQLDSERGELHVTCVELFYRLHCLAPTASVCEDIVCLALQHREKVVQLEALHRFSVLWHLTREIQNNRSVSLNRSFDRSLFVVLDCLNSPDGSVRTAGQSWLIRALSLNDVARILEPILLLLLHPETQRCSIQCLMQNLAGGHLKMFKWKDRAISHNAETSLNGIAMESLSEDTLLSWLAVVDREVLWADLEHVPEMVNVPELPEEGRRWSEDTEGEDEESRQDAMEEEQEESEHTESADTSGAQLSTEDSGSGSAPYLQRVDSERTQASESLSSEEEEEELAAMARLRHLKQLQERREAVDALYRHTLLYLQPYNHARILHAFGALESLIRTNGQPFVEAVSTTTLDTGSAAHLGLVQNLLQRHQESLEGRSFYGRWQPQSMESGPQCLLIELLVSVCLSFLRSHYPRYLQVGALEVRGNLQVKVTSVEVLTCLLGQLIGPVRDHERRSLDLVCQLLSSSGLQRYVLLSLSTSMHVSQRPGIEKDKEAQLSMDVTDGLSEERMIEQSRDAGCSEQALQVELLKLLQVLVVLEHHAYAEGGVEKGTTAGGTSPLAREWQTAQQYQQSIRAQQYIPAQPITAQGMFVSAAASALLPRYGYAMHPPWVSMICSSLPYLGRSLAVIVAPFIAQICKNLDELVRQYEHEVDRASHSVTFRRESIALDYPLTLMEGLTTITHYCLLDNRKSPVIPDPVDLRNARNAILEEMPRAVSTMALLWSVVRREEGQRKGSDTVQTARNTTTSVCFRNAKVLRLKVLEFLDPLMAPFGVQVMASVGAVWNTRRSKKGRNKNKVLPVASESRLTIVDLVKSLSTLRTNTILHLVKEVVKKPHQIKGDSKSTLVDIPLLQFSYTFIQSICAQALQENITPLLCLLKESVQMNLAPPGQFLLLGILNDLVNRLPNLDNKKYSKDLQEVTQRILEAVGSVAGSSLEQTSWLSRNLEVKAQPQVCPEEDDLDEPDLYDLTAQPNAMVSSSAPSVYSVQALSLLAEVLAPLLDMVYRSDEKEKAVPLISRIMYYVFPYLKNHSNYNMPSFCAGAQLLSSLSGYAYTKRAWKKEAFDLFMDPLFFHMDAACVPHWKSIVDHLLTHEKTVFKELMTMQSSSLKVLPNQEQKALLLKRQAFSVFSGELDQYHLYLPLIQERLTENLRVGQTPSVAAQMFLTFRVLLLRISPQHLTSLWPIMVTELIHTFVQLERSLVAVKEVSKPVGRGNVGRGVPGRHGPARLFLQSELDMYLSACKFLDMALSFPPDRMPLFQMYRWAFVPEVDTENYSGPENGLMEGEQECQPHILRILEGLHHRFEDLNGTGETKGDVERPEFPLLTMRSISCISELWPFLHILSCSFRCPSIHRGPQPMAQYPVANSDLVLNRLELVMEQEFLESVEG